MIIFFSYGQETCTKTKSFTAKNGVWNTFCGIFSKWHAIRPALNNILVSTDRYVWPLPASNVGRIHSNRYSALPTTTEVQRRLPRAGRRIRATRIATVYRYQQHLQVKRSLSSVDYHVSSVCPFAAVRLPPSIVLLPPPSHDNYKSFISIPNRTHRPW